MAGVQLKIDVDERALREALTRIAALGGSMRLAFADMGEYLLESHDQRFRDQVSPGGKPWDPLSPKYRARKKRNSNRILYLDGQLAGLLRYQATDQSLDFGTDRIYGATHHFGDPERGIPERPWLGISEADRSQLIAIAARHLAAAGTT